MATSPSILTTLGVGSGIDSKALVASLAAAARASRDIVLTAAVTSNTAKISTLATITASLASFASTFDQDTQDSTITTAKIAQEFVAGFNALRAMIATATAVGATSTDSGPLVGDSGIRSVASALAALPQTALAGGTTARSLNDLGIATNRDGSLRVDSAKLKAAVAADPDGVRAMLTATGGLDQALGKVTTALTATGGFLSASTARYTRAAGTLKSQQDQVNTDNAALIDRLTTSFTQMDKQVALIKSSQAYLTQQIASWNSTK